MGFAKISVVNQVPEAPCPVCHALITPDMSFFDEFHSSFRKRPDIGQTGLFSLVECLPSLKKPRSNASRPSSNQQKRPR